MKVRHTQACVTLRESKERRTRKEVSGLLLLRYTFKNTWSLLIALNLISYHKGFPQLYHYVRQ